jgi:hypothetical protein
LLSILGVDPYHAPRVEWTSDGTRLVIRDESLQIVDIGAGSSTSQPRPSSPLDGFALDASRGVLFFAETAADASGYVSRLYAAAPIGAAPKELPFSRRLYPDGTELRGAINLRGVTPRGAVAWFYDNSDTYRLHALHNLGNGAAVIRGARPVGGTGIRFEGIATDTHLESYTIAVRTYQSEEPPVVVGQGITPVVDGELGIWMPPGPGLYEAKLTVIDKAGNATEGSTIVAWGSTPSIARLTVTPPLFSPNGDGVLDATTVGYTVVLPGETDFTITDESARVVRTIHRVDSQPGFASFIWDGRNDAGNIVGDGAYRVDGRGVSQLVEVDATPPGVEVYADSRLNLELGGAAIWGPPQWQYCTACTLVPAREAATAPDGTFAEYPTDAGWMTWRVKDLNLTGFDIEIAAAGSTQFAPYVSTPNIATPRRAAGLLVPASDLRGAVFRGVARDRAGNVGYSEPVAFEEKLMLTGIGDAAAFDPVASGLLSYNGRLAPRVDLLDHVKSYSYDRSLDIPVGAETPTMVPTPLPFEPKPYAVSFAPIIGAPIVAYAVQYQALDGQTVTDTGNVTMVAEDAIVWDASRLPRRSFVATFIATDALGRTFTASVPFMSEPRLDTCMGVHRSDDGTYHERLTVAANVGFLDVGADALAPGISMRFTRPGQASPELVISPDIGEPRLPSAASYETMLVYSLTVDTASLSACEYRLDFEGRTVAGNLVLGHTDVQLCGLQRVGLAVADGKRLKVPLFETYRQAFTRVDWFASKREDASWKAAGSITAFEGYGELPIEQGGCPGPEIGFKTVLAGGEVPTGFVACPYAVGGEQPCADVRLVLTDATPAVGVCTPNNRAYAVTATINSQDPWHLGLFAASLESPTRGKVADVPMQGLQPEAQTKGAATISTATLADDVLRLRAKYLFEAPGATAVQGTTDLETPIIVDHTRPMIAIGAPADGQHLCPVEVAQPDGTVRKMLPF